MSTDGNGNLANQNKLVWFELGKSFNQFQKIAGHGLPGFGLELDLLSIAKDQAAEAIPLRLVLPTFTLRDNFDQASFHGWKRSRERQTHSKVSRRNRPLSCNNGFHKSPNSRTRAGTFFKVKSS